MKRKSKLILSFSLKVLLGLFIIFPLIVAFITGFMPKEDVFSIPFRLTLENATLQNYIYSFQNMNLLVYFKNTFIMIGICLPAQIITALLAAYAFSYFEFPLKNMWFTILLMVMMIPGEVITVSLYKMIMGWGMIDTYAGLTITGLTNVGAMFMFRQTMMSIPKSLWEAAKMDGCSDMRYFVKILVPLCKTIIVTQVLNGFIGIYNNYMWPLMVTTKDAMRTIQTGVAYITISGQHYGVVLAASTITIIIPMLIYIFGLDSIVEGMTAGAVKN